MMNSSARVYMLDSVQCYLSAVCW